MTSQDLDQWENPDHPNINHDQYPDQDRPSYSPEELMYGEIPQQAQSEPPAQFEFAGEVGKAKESEKPQGPTLETSSSTSTSNSARTRTKAEEVKVHINKTPQSNRIHQAKQFKLENKILGRLWFHQLVLKAGWGMGIFLFLRLILADGGIIDYLKMEKRLHDKQQVLDAFHEENNFVFNEILKIESDSSYQKQMARDHLGVIAADEFLILFAREQEKPTGR